MKIVVNYKREVVKIYFLDESERRPKIILLPITEPNTVIIKSRNNKNKNGELFNIEMKKASLMNLSRTYIMLITDPCKEHVYLHHCQEHFR